MAMCLVVIVGRRAHVHAQPTLRSAHFVVIAPPGTVGEMLVDELEAAYVHVRTWGLRLPARIDVRGYSTTDSYVRASGAPRTTLAATVDGTLHLQPQGILVRSGSLQRTLRHELVHAALRRAERRGIPRWFNEGLAMHVAGERHPETVAFTSVDALERVIGQHEDHARTKSGYETARRLVERLEREHGRAALTDLVLWTATRGGFAGRFRQVTGVDPVPWTHRRLPR